MVASSNSAALSGSMFSLRFWVLAAPLLLGGGILLYFALPFEPSLPLLLTVFLGSCAAVILLLKRSSAWWFALALTIAITSGGTLSAKTESWMKRAPVLKESITNTMIEGRIVRINPLTHGATLFLEQLKIEGLVPAATPQQLRLFTFHQDDRLASGAHIKARAALDPSPRPVYPGAFNPARYDYFARVGGRGKILAIQEVIPAPGSYLERIRMGINNRVEEMLGQTRGSVATGLMTGFDSKIPKAILNDMKDSGLMHLLAVSGFNIGLAAGFFFYCSRLILAFFPPLPAKRIAAAIALVASFAYLSITGFPVSAVRAFVAVALLLLAILFDRVTRPIASLAWAGVFLLLIEPSSILSAGFQLSFAATLGLICWFDRSERQKPAIAFSTPLRYFGEILGSTIVAAVATAPALIYHFGNFAGYGLVANLVAIPLTSFWLMPLALLALVLMPLGLDWLPLQLMAKGIDFLVHWASQIASLPHALFTPPPIPAYAYAIMTVGWIAFCISRGKIRLIGAAIFMIGFLPMAFYTPPDIAISSEGKTLAIKFGDTAWLAKGSPSSNAAKNWKRYLEVDSYKLKPPTSEELVCDHSGCIIQRQSIKIAIPKELSAIEEDCANADLVVILVEAGGIPEGCRTIDLVHLARAGATAIWLQKDKIWVKSYYPKPSTRLWDNSLDRVFHRSIRQP